MCSEQPGRVWSNADAYEAIIGRWSRPAAEAALDWLSLPSGLNWLDVGCGPGATIETILANEAPSAVLGVDPAPEFLELARKLVPDRRVAFQAGTASALPVRDASFDIVISGLVLHFVPAPDLALQEMVRAVRPGGTVAGYLWALTNNDQFTRPFWRAAHALDPDAKAWDLAHMHRLNELERLFDLFATSTLEQVDAARIAIPTVFRDFDDYWLPCLFDGTTPIQLYARSLTPDRQAALAERLRSELPIASDGSIPLSGHIWIARGTRTA